MGGLEFLMLLRCLLHTVGSGPPGTALLKGLYFPLVEGSGWLPAAMAVT